VVGQNHRGRFLSSLKGDSGRRGYNGRSEERKVYKFPEGFDFVQTFPDRPTIENMRKAGRTTSNPPPKKRKAEPWSLDDLELYRKHFEVEDMVLVNTDSNPRSTTPSHAMNEPVGHSSEQGNEQEGNAEVLEGARRGLIDSSLEDSRRDVEGASAGLAEIHRTHEDEIVSKITSELGSSVVAISESRASDIEEKAGAGSDQGPRNMNVGAQKEIGTAITPDELPSNSPTLVQSDSNPDSNPITSKSEDVREEARLSLQADADLTAILDDEELERAMQHFNLGMWHKPWRPPPNESELKKRHEKEECKQLELEKETAEFNPTIHILGLGTAGKYIAHALASLPDRPPITLLMHRPLLMHQWHHEGAAIRILVNGEYHVRTGFHIESSSKFRKTYSGGQLPRFGPNLEHSAEPPNTVIDTLVVTTDANTTLLALSSIKHRLRKSTTIFILQDGLGMIEKLNATIFLDPLERPTYILGRISHNLKSTDRQFTIVEKEIGQIHFTKLAQVVEAQQSYFHPNIKRENLSWSLQARHLSGSMIKAPELNSKSLGYKKFFVTQLQRLVVSAVIGPMSVALDCSNEQLLYNYHASQNIRFLLEEILGIILKLPELQRYNLLEKRFNVARFENIIISVLKKSGENTSSMLQDVRSGRQTDIEFYNGYLVRRAKELGIDCLRNEMFLHLVRGKLAIKDREENMYIPFRGG
jgi:2-dehydropantoate 2-reductase